MVGFGDLLLECVYLAIVCLRLRLERGQLLARLLKCLGLLLSLCVLCVECFELCGDSCDVCGDGIYSSVR